jgi:hypothetical protein
MRFLLRSLPVGAGPLLLLTVACTTIHTVQPADLSRPNPPARIRVTRADHTTAVFDSARVSADTLIGMVNGQPQRLPLSEATVLRVREPAPDRTAGLVFLGASGVLALTVYLLRTRPPSPVCPLPCAEGVNCCGNGP